MTARFRGHGPDNGKLFPAAAERLAPDARLHHLDTRPPIPVTGTLPIPCTPPRRSSRNIDLAIRNRMCGQCRVKLVAVATSARSDMGDGGDRDTVCVGI